MSRPVQNTNQSLSQVVEALNTGGLVASPFTGSVNISVLLFTAATTLTAATPFMTAVNSAANGTSLTIFKPGRYSVELGLATLAGVAPTFGISQDVAAAGLTGVPAFTIAGFTDVLPSLVPAATNIPIKITSELVVSRAQAQAGSVIRFHAALAGPAAPAASIVQTSAYFRVRNIGAAYV